MEFKRQQNRACITQKIGVLKFSLMHGRLHFLIAIITLHCIFVQCAPTSIPMQRSSGHSEGTFCNSEKEGWKEASVFGQTNVFDSARKIIRFNEQQVPSQEYTIAFGRTNLGLEVLSDITPGGRSSSIVAAVTNAFADIHNHPNQSPPSSGDLYGLMLRSRKSAGYKTRYVVTAGEVVYALVVTDTAAVRIFLETYPPQQVPGYSPLFPDDLLTEYRDILYKYGAAEEAAMAYLLKTYKAGVVLLKQEGSGDFKKINITVHRKGNDRRFVVAYCSG